MRIGAAPSPPKSPSPSPLPPKRPTPPSAANAPPIKSPAVKTQPQPQPANAVPLAEPLLLYERTQTSSDRLFDSALIFSFLGIVTYGYFYCA